jgi:serine/threonine-protein kinase RsbW
MSDAARPTAPFRRELASRLEEIASLARDLEAWADSAGVPARVTGGVNLMLDELVTNTILHGYGGRADGEIRVEAELLPGALQVRLVDYAFPYDPLEAAAPDLEASLEDRAVGGLGVHFVRQMADEIDYARIEEGGRGANRLRFVRRFGTA